MTDSEGERRVQVNTRVPEYQKAKWKEHAEDLEMSQSEFIRSMVQAGRRGFILDESDESTEDHGDGPSNPRGNDLETRVQECLSEEGVMSWEELVSEIVDDIESQLDEALQSLQDENRIRYSGREGGYVLSDGE